METKTSLESLFEKTTGYMETRMDLFKLKTTDKTSEVVSSLIESLILIFIIVLALLIFSIGMALLIGEVLGKTYYGFFIIAGFYSVTGLVFFIFRRVWLKEPVTNLLIRKIFN